MRVHLVRRATSERRHTERCFRLRRIGIAELRRPPHACTIEQASVEPSTDFAHAARAGDAPTRSPTRRAVRF
ncbi:hypothetical protein WK35_13860 [Burkholderia vietnamiensis]|nr:hypothetical protein WK35_13860 [Burkholderia vietnamiensis]